MDNRNDVAITELKGVGPKKSQLFSKLGIFTVDDALYSFPREYEDRRNIKRIGDAMDGEDCMINAEIIAVAQGRYVRGKKQTVRLRVSDGTGIMNILFFNASYMLKALKSGKRYWFFGRVSFEAGGKAMLHPQYGLVEDEGEKNDILPVYPLISGLSQKERRKVIQQCLSYVNDDMECLRNDTRERYNMCGIEYALNNIHYPKDGHKMRAAKYRLIFEELLIFSLGLQLMKNEFEKESSFYILEKTKYEDEFVRGLPFELTEGQEKAIEDICNDMSSGKRMNRLIQGDVGCGKTVVGAAAIYKAIKNGHQAVFMAPTEILARQHFKTFCEFFKEYGIEPQLLISGLSSKEKKEVLKKAEEGSTELIIGTHALFSENVKFSDLALVITDEQHRFGVMQRDALSQKGNNPHILVMTATPIPRTLALILYGDMDVSVIKGKPSGRRDIITKVWKGVQRNEVYGFVYDELKKGRQAYIVSPMIEASETINVKSSEEIFDEVKELFKPYKTELLHGKMKPDEKEDIMSRFSKGEVQVLVSTVIIEVGINVPNASVMVIENSERFGLAQMHQLRGRVGRGSEQSYCMLIIDTETEVAIKRAEAMEKYNDGLIIAEKDLELRGTGEFFGVRQHGIPDMRIADIIRHSKILKETMKESKRIMSADPLLNDDENSKLKARIIELYGDLKPSL